MTQPPGPPLFTNLHHRSRSLDPVASQWSAWLNPNRRLSESLNGLVVHYLYHQITRLRGLSADDVGYCLGKPLPVNSNYQKRTAGELVREYRLAEVRFTCRGCRAEIVGEVDPNAAHMSGGTRPYRPAMPWLPVNRAFDNNPCPTCGTEIGRNELNHSLFPAPGCSPRYLVYVNDEGLKWGEHFYRGNPLPKNFRQSRSNGASSPPSSLSPQELARKKFEKLFGPPVVPPAGVSP